jgi:SAM-dependent methyltransferase
VDAEHGYRWPIRNYVPCFVDDDGYAGSFGYQWNHYRRTQIDRFNGTSLSADRFYQGTGWDPTELKGQRILEVGCGAGRFTEVMLDAGAEVWATDVSTAVEACWENNGPHANLTVARADLHAGPFQREAFDRIFCFGVLQHTPDPQGAFRALLPFLRPGGHIAVDVYRKVNGLRDIDRYFAKYLWRPLTRRLPPASLRRFVEWYVPRWLPVDNVLRRVPKIGQFLVAVVPCWNYTGALPLTDTQIREWAILDTFDALSARFDLPQTLDQVESWLMEAGLKDVQVRPGGNGILGTARR